MLKKRFVTREDWTRILEREFKQLYISDTSFSGYISLLTLNKVKEPLWTYHCNKKICIVDNGYSWLQQLPEKEHFAITTMFNESNEIIQWYIDITTHNGIENGVPYMEDLFLDLIVLPTGEIIKKDLEEIEEALDKGWITKEQYNLAFSTFNTIYEELQNDTFKYIKLSNVHRERLLRGNL